MNLHNPKLHFKVLQLPIEFTMLQEYSGSVFATSPNFLQHVFYDWKTPLKHFLVIQTLEFNVF